MKAEEAASHLDLGHSTVPAVSDHHVFCLSVRPDLNLLSGSFYL